MIMARFFLFIGALNAAFVVAAGAYGAHALKEQASAAVFQTAVQYHMFHALGLILVGVAATLRPGTAWFAWSGALMLAGILLFCGTLYVSATTGYRGLNGLAPLGGSAFIVSWLLFAIGALRS